MFEAGIWLGVQLDFRGYFHGVFVRLIVVIPTICTVTASVVYSSIDFLFSH
jgi:hypothetical protein